MIYYSLVRDTEARIFHMSQCMSTCVLHRDRSGARHALRGYPFADGVSHVPTCIEDAYAVVRMLACWHCWA